MTHTLGDAAAGLALIEGRLMVDGILSDDDQLFLETRFYEPTARLEEAHWLRDSAHAAIDISDGLLADVGHIAAASGLACTIDASSLPMSRALQQLPTEQATPWALHGGDDYELALAVPPEADLPDYVTPIGYFTVGEGVSCDYPGVANAGYDHFSG